MPQVTRNALINWANGSADGEYLASGLLLIENYQEVNPIHPQGGPDGKKDILCKKEEILFVVACYFPNNSTLIKFEDLKNKFLEDLVGVKRNGAKGFIFITNVPIKSGDREKLEKFARAKKHQCSVCLIYHLERILVLLDAPKGFGLRQKILGINMTPEEAVSAQQVNEEHMRAEFNKRIENVEKENTRLLKMMESAFSAAPLAYKKKRKAKAKKKVRKIL